MGAGLDRQRSQTLRLAHHPGISAWNEVPEPPGLRSHLLLQISSAGIGVLPLLRLKHGVFRDRESSRLGQGDQLLQGQWLSELLCQSRIVMTQAKQLIEILQRHGPGATEIDLHQHPTRSALNPQ